jgi:D-glycerate 3-kinase
MKVDITAMKNSDLTDFITKHRLPETYILDAQQWFAPVAETIAGKWKKAGKPLIVGINGSQGSGKSTLADYLALLCRKKYHLNVVVLSIDDFYLTLQQRILLSKTVHPLMATRGVPGSHDIELALDVIRSLTDGSATTLIPRFDKSVDDRFPQDKWDTVASPTDLIILEGWCVGATAQTEKALLEPVNELEKEEDPDAIWRNYVNQQLAGVYQELFNMVDIWIMLKAPSFDCVYQWRLEQEKKLRNSLSNSSSGTDSNKIMDDSGVKRFIQHYQRITEHLLDTLPEKVDILFELDENRKVLNTKP